MQAKSLRAYGVRSGPSPLHDVYKLLMFLASRASATNKPVYRELEKIFRFFNDTEDFAYCLREQSPAKGYYYIYPNTEYTLSRTIGEFLNYAERAWNLNEIVSDTPLHDELRCTSCYTFAGVLRGSNTFSANFITSANSFEKFYDVAIYLSKHGVSHYDELVQSFDYAAAKDKFRERCQREAFKIQVHKDMIQPLVTLNDPKKLGTKAAEKGHILAHLHLFELVSAYESLELLLKIGVSVATVFQDTDLVNEIGSWRKALRDAEPAIRAQIQTARTNYQRIYKIISTDAWMRVYEKPFPWYSVSAGDIETLVTRFKRDTSELFKEARLPAALFVPSIQNMTTKSVPVVQPESPRRSKNLVRNSPAYSPTPKSSVSPTRSLYPEDSKLNIAKDRNGRVTDISLID